MEKGKNKFLPTRKLVNETVQVLVRCRPMSEKETSNAYMRVVDVDPTRGTIEIKNPKSELKDAKKTFTFDAVFDWNASQEDVYEMVRPLVSSVLSGFNGTIFAYGQTGAGKTYTMEGCLNDASKRGIILRSFDQIFKHISRSKDVQFLVRSSYLEIYQEEIRDLLSENGTKCEIRERCESGVYIKDLSSFVCKNTSEITNVMSIGNENRSIGATNMNEHSSRSHAILTVTVEMLDLASSEVAQRIIRVGKLNLVDLAGSERQSKSGAKGGRLKEASKINLSLSALGNVISALVDGRTTHIPYRDSKLTRLLQDSLGGNSKTIMVANIGPASYNYEESLTTLRYAQRAKSIKNKPKVNEDPKDALLREYQEEIARLKELLAERTTYKNKFSEVQSGNVIDSKETLYVAPDNKSSEVSEEETKHMEELERQRKEIAEDKKLTEELEKKIASMESKLLCGGKNIIDHTNEQQRALELRVQEIAEKKLAEVVMRQKLELQEDMALNIHSSYSSLQQEVEVKTRKLKKLFSKFQAIKQEVQDLTEEFNRDRRELELSQNELLKTLKKKHMIIENFIPVEEKNSLVQRLVYSEEEDEWTLKRSELSHVGKRPVSTCDRRPISDYGRVATHVGHNYRYQAENLLNLQPKPSDCMTQDYLLPAISPKMRAILDHALRAEEDLDIDASKLIRPPTRRPGSNRNVVVGPPKKTGVASAAGSQKSSGRLDSSTSNKLKQDPVYPKARGLVPKK